jgi:hypothetical protein
MLSDFQININNNNNTHHRPLLPYIQLAMVQPLSSYFLPTHRHRTNSINSPSNPSSHHSNHRSNIPKETKPSASHPPLPK